MKHTIWHFANLMTLFLLFSFPLLQGCSDDTELDRQPSAVQNLIEQYYPGVGVSSASWQGQVYNVKLRSGVIIGFDTSYDWVSVNGYGSYVPSVFLFDKLPPAFYEYLQGIEAVNKVYAVSRDKEEYTVELQDNSVIYNIETGRITFPIMIETVQLTFGY